MKGGTDLPPGTRVRHSGERWGAAYEHGTATVVGIVSTCRDGSVEYEIERDRPLLPHMSTRTQWNSDHTIPVDVQP